VKIILFNAKVKQKTAFGLLNDRFFLNACNYWIIAIALPDENLLYEKLYSEIVQPVSDLFRYQIRVSKVL